MSGGDKKVKNVTESGRVQTKRDATEFRERYKRWKSGEKVYSSGKILPKYEDGKQDEFAYEMNTTGSKKLNYMYEPVVTPNGVSLSKHAEFNPYTEEREFEKANQEYWGNVGGGSVTRGMHQAAGQLAPYVLSLINPISFATSMIGGTFFDAATEDFSKGKYKNWGNMISDKTGMNETIAGFTNPGYLLNLETPTLEYKNDLLKLYFKNHNIDLNKIDAIAKKEYDRIINLSNKDFEKLDFSKFGLKKSRYGGDRYAYANNVKNLILLKHFKDNGVNFKYVNNYEGIKPAYSYYLSDPNSIQWTNKINYGNLKDTQILNWKLGNFNFPYYGFLARATDIKPKQK